MKFGLKFKQIVHKLRCLSTKLPHIVSYLQDSTITNKTRQLNGEGDGPILEKTHCMCQTQGML